MQDCHKVWQRLFLPVVDLRHEWRLQQAWPMLLPFLLIRHEVYDPPLCRLHLRPRHPLHPHRPPIFQATSPS